MAPKGATLRLSARSNKTESHVERMARAGLQKAADGLPEMDRLLAEGLPKAVEQFVGSLRKLQSRDDLLNSAVPLEPAKNLRQVVWHFRDLSWRTAVHPEQATKLGEALAEPLKIIQAISVLIEGMDLQSLIRGESPDNLAGALLLGLENWTLYCVLASSYGVPHKLVIEEVTAGILKSLKEMLRQIIGPLQASESDRSKKAPGEGQAGDLPFSAEHASALCTSVAELLQALHEFLSRHRLAEDQLHQLIHIALSIFFLGEPNFRLCAAAEEVLVTIFSRHEALRSSVLQEFLSRAPRLPTGKRAKKFQMPATEESGAYGLSTWTHLLLRLCQSACLPLREPIGSDVDFESVVECRPAAQSVISQLVAGLLQRLVLSRSKDEEARLIMEDFTDEVFSAAFKPMWPGALALLRQMVQQLIAFLQEKKQAGDITVREFTLKLLSRAEIRLWHHATQSSQARVELPQWTEPPEEVAKHAKEGRLLQHIALRVSLEDGRDMPWSEAARIVEAWDAELFLSKGAGDEQAQGLTSLSDDIVFLHLTLAFLSDECTAPLLLPPMGTESSAAAPAAPLSAAVFGAGHPVHAWSFLVCDCAEAASPSEDAASRRRGSMTPLQRFLASAWCSPTLVCDTASWRMGGRRVLLPYTVYKVYRQLRSQELDGLRKAALDCIVMQANSPMASLRKTAMRALSDLVDMDISVLSLRAVEETVDMRLRDESSWVRQVSLDLLGRILEGSLAEGSGEAGSKRASAEGSHGGSDASARDMLLRFHKTVRGRVNDTAVIVRRQATKILSAFVLNHPDHPDVVPVTLDLLRRSTDSEALRNLVLGTFELLWFMDDEPTPEAARQLCRVVDASRSMVAAVGDVLQELLRRFRKSIGSRKNSKGYEFAIRRWTTLILNEFVRTKCGYGSETPPFKKAKGPKIELQAAESAEEQWLMRRSLLSTLEAFSVTQPKDLLVHLRPLTIYLALEDDSPPEDQWVAIKVCRILASVLPYVAERRGLMDHRQVQVDLQALIRNQPSSGVHEAVRCLCLVVKFVTGDLAQIISHLNVAVPSLSRLCTSAEQKPGSLERIQLLYMSRQAWVLASIMECLNIDDYVQIEGLSAEEQPKRRLLPRSDLKFEFLGDSVASTVLDLLLRLNAIGEPQLRAVAASCMGFFLKGHRGFTKDRRVVELLSSALSSSDLLLCRKALETLSALLSHFRSEADRESKAGAADFADSRDGRVAGTSQSGHSLVALQGPSSQRSASAKAGSAAVEASSKTNSAIEAAQPLAAFADVVLSHITLAGSVGPAAGVPSPKKSQSTKRGRSVPETEEENDQGSPQDTEKAEGVLRVRVEALSVVRHLHQQGLVNPMAVLPKVFALTFAGDPRLSEATAMLKEMLELRPSLLLNRLDEAFREAFLALLSAATAVRLGEAVVPQQLLGLGDVYMERFRKQKTLRDTFLRKALRELQRLQTNRSEERFAELAALGVVGVEDAGGSSATRKAGSRGPGRIPLRQQQQLLYAQFLASAVTSLPFAFENEPLLVVFECNHHLALHAGALLASADGTAGIVKEKEMLSPEQVFTEALSIVSCVVLKTVLRREYNLSSEQCATFNPKELRQERIKAFPTGGFGRGEDGQTPARNRFPANEWLEKISPLIENFGRPEEMISYIRTITDADPWDDSRSRHEAKLDVLEGRRGRKGKAAKGGKNELKASKVKKAEPPAARGRGRGRGEQKGNIKKKGRRKQGMCDSEDDSDWEEPGARKRPRVQAQEPAEADDGAAQEDSEEELEAEDAD